MPPHAGTARRQPKTTLAFSTTKLLGPGVIADTNEKTANAMSCSTLTRLNQIRVGQYFDQCRTLMRERLANRLIEFFRLADAFAECPA